MNDRTAELILAAAAECGALAAFVALYEINGLAAGKEFTTAEVTAHARLPENARLHAAIVAVCGDLSARRLAKVLSQWRAKHIGLGLRLEAIGDDQGWILWKFVGVDPIPVQTTAANDALMTVSQRCKELMQ